VRCDPTDDSRLSESTQHLCVQSRKIDFDGRRDALLNIMPEHILTSDGVLLPHIDHVLEKERRSPPIFLRLVQLYMDFLRQRGKEFSDVDSVQKSFFGLLEKEFPEEHALLREVAMAESSRQIAVPVRR
jgi:hypothetical protein